MADLRRGTEDPARDAQQNDSAANEAADNSSAMDDAAGGRSERQRYSYTYAAVQKDSAHEDSFPPTKACRRTAPLTVPPMRTTITPSSRLILPRRRISSAHGMAMYVEAEDSEATSSCRRTARELEALPLERRSRARRGRLL